MKISKKIVQFLTVAIVAVGFSLSASGQAPGGPPPGQPDEVDQLAQMLGLTEEQQTEIRSVINEVGPQIDELQTKAQGVQRELQTLAGPDFDEDEIRKTASELGELTGEITALTVILQSRVQQIFTVEQRQELEDLERQQQEMQQQQMQQQMQRQMEQQMQQQQQQGQQPQQQQRLPESEQRPQ